VSAAAPKKKPAKKRTKPTFTEQARRKQILEASAETFSTRGYDATSLDDIARAVGVSRGVIFYYFDGKSEIGEQAVKQCLRLYGNYVRERVAAKSTAREQLLEFVDACLDYLDIHRKDYLLYVDLIGCFGNAEEKYSISVSANRNTRDWLVGIIKQGQKDGDIARLPVTTLADVIQGIVDGMMELSALEPETVDIDSCKKLLRQMILRTIEPKG
jgi:AcrR family transcriptional regulator